MSRTSRLYPKYWYGIGANYGNIDLITVNYGIIFWLPFRVSTIHFTVDGITGDDYVQTGMCQYDASLPTIVTQGTGRVEFVNIMHNGDQNFNVNGVVAAFLLPNAILLAHRHPID